MQRKNAIFDADFLWHSEKYRTFSWKIEWSHV